MVHAYDHDADDDADQHDESCSCVRCERRALSVAFAGVGGGVSAFGHSVLGAGWVEADGMSDQAVGVESLAQRALGSVFEQLERIGEAGRTKCLGERFKPYTDPLPSLTRRDAVELLRCAENALDYARVHLDYLARVADNEPPRFRNGDRVVVPSPEENGEECEGSVVAPVDNRPGLVWVKLFNHSDAAHPVGFDERDVRHVVEEREAS